MVDPHVVAVSYRIEHSKAVAYDGSPPLHRNEPQFRLKIEDKRVRFEFKEHYASEGDARHAIADYIESWQRSAELQCGPDSFVLVFLDAEIIDRQPPPPRPGVVELRARATVETPRGFAALTIGLLEYPEPPSGCDFQDPLVQRLHIRYMDHRRGKEPLAGMAYFCLTVLEDSVNAAKRRRQAAARTWQIDKAVLDEIARLSSTRGGHGARKAVGVTSPLTPTEERFLDEAIKATIRQVARIATKPSQTVRNLTLSVLPPHR